MPAYNAELYIGEAIQSILDQTMQDFELIILDDGSTDGTAAIVQTYLKRDQRVRLIISSKNEGISIARNMLIRHAVADIIAWQDADDISIADRLENQLHLLDNHPDIGICGGFLEFFNEQGVLNVRKYAKHDAELRATIFRYSPVSQGVAMIRKRCFLDRELVYSPGRPGAEDLHMSFMIGENWKFGNVQKVLLRYRIYPASTTFRKLNALEKDTLCIRKKFWRNKAYSHSWIDYLFNIGQLISMSVIPVKWRIAIFSWFRNSKS